MLATEKTGSFQRIRRSVSSVGRRVASRLATVSRTSLLSTNESNFQDASHSTEVHASAKVDLISSSEVLPLFHLRKSGLEKDQFSCRQAQKIAKEMISRADEEYGVATFHFEQIDAEERYRKERGHMLCQVRYPALPMVVIDWGMTKMVMVVVVPGTGMVVIVMMIVMMRRRVVMVGAIVDTDRDGDRYGNDDGGGYGDGDVAVGGVGGTIRNNQQYKSRDNYVCVCVCVRTLYQSYPYIRRLHQRAAFTMISVLIRSFAFLKTILSAATVTATCRSIGRRDDPAN